MCYGDMALQLLTTLPSQDRFAMLTLTYDPKRYTSLESWLRYYTDMAQFVKQFRKDFKQHNPQCLWVCEKHRDGRPHVHCNIYLDKQIQQYPNSRDYLQRKFTFREYHDYVKSTWEYGISDVTAFYKDGLLHGLRYPLKYLFKARLKSPDWLKLLLESQEPSPESTTPKEPLTEDPTGYMGQDGLYHTPSCTPDLARPPLPL